MAAPDLTLAWQCAKCGFREETRRQAALARLRQAGLLRRDAKPETPLLLELAAKAKGIPCPQCGAAGLTARVQEDNPEDWGDARRCEGCGEPIAAERLEALPQTRVCARCQSQDERRPTGQTNEYCPRCGELLMVRRAAGGGVARYTLHCPQCGSIA